jgi:uncharacterized protein with GYD domain
MATYITLIHFTDQGVRHIKESPKRAEAFQEMATKAGVTVKHVFWTLGRYDMVAITEAPDDITGTALGLQLGSQGNVRTQTMRAFGPQEIKQILDKIP